MAGLLGSLGRWTIGTWPILDSRARLAHGDYEDGGMLPAPICSR